MKFGRGILDTKLQNGIENQSITVQGSTCFIFRVARMLQNKNFLT